MTKDLYDSVQLLIGLEQDSSKRDEQTRQQKHEEDRSELHVVNRQNVIVVSDDRPKMDHLEEGNDDEDALLICQYLHVDIHEPTGVFVVIRRRVGQPD